MRRLAPLAALSLLLVLVLGTCDDQPTIPEQPDPPAAEISDAFHGETGNPHFFWLPPMVPQPESFNGAFDGDSDPVVTVCELTDTGCTLLVHGSTGDEAVYTVNDGPGGVVVQVDPVEEHFLVTWHTDEFNTSVGPTYRIRVALGATLLGVADVTLAETGKEATKKNEITGETETITLKDGRTLPVTFRVEGCANPTQPCTTAIIESGEETTVTLTDEEGEVFSEVSFPSGWTATDENGDPVEKLTLTVEKRPVFEPAVEGEDASCFQVVKVNDPGTGEPESCVKLRADTDTEFDVEVTFVRTDDGFLPVLTFCPDADVLDSPNLDRYVMTSVEDDVPPALQNRRTYAATAGLDCTGSDAVGFGDGPADGLLALGERLLSSAASLLLPQKLWAIDGGFGGELDGLSTIFFFAIDKEAEVVSAPTVTEAAVGTDLGTVEVEVRSTHPTVQPLPGEELTFSFMRPELPVGTFDQPVVVTDANGIAAHNWTLGAAGGRNTLFIFGEAGDTARLEVLGLGRVSLWKGDGDNDDAVGQNHGTRENIDPDEDTQTVPFATGIVGQAFDFDGTGDVVTFPARNIRTAPHLTVATWVNLDPDGPAEEIQRFVTVGGARAVLRQNNPPDGGARQLHFYMNIDDESDGVFDTDGTDLHHITLDIALATGCWHHVAGTYDGTTMRLYLDGAEVGSLAVSGEQWPNAGAVHLSHPADPGDGVPFNEALYGRLDEVEVHNVALSATEIGAIWDGTSGADKCPEGAAVEQAIAGSFLDWWNANHHFAMSPGPALSVAADDHTSSWGNFGMKDAGSEPRQAFPNDPAYAYSFITEEPWGLLHGNLHALGEALRRIQGGLVIGSSPAETQRARTFAKFMQGLSLGTLALLFDQAFIVTEDTDPPPSSFSPYADVMAAAVASLEEAISLAQSSSFTVPSEWVGGATVDAARLARLAYSYKARFRAYVGRTPSEREVADWAAIRSDIQQGITTDFGVFTSGTCETCFVDVLKIWGGVLPVWARIDVRTLGPADQSGGYQNWLATPLLERTPFLVDTDDRRVTSQDHFASPAAGQEGLYVHFYGEDSSPFLPERGTYHFSDYGDARFLQYATSVSGLAVDLPVAELRLLEAEALLRLGDVAGALSILNATRTTNGELPAATTTGVQGQARCVPRDAAGDCGDVFEVLKYEKRIETFHYGMGTAFFDDRGWGDLVDGTYFHFPVPGAVLEELGLPIYTFGGSEPLM